MVFIFLLIFSCCGFSTQSLDYDSCKIESTTWNGKEVKKMVLNITTYEECSQICRQEKKQRIGDQIQGFNCDYFTWNDGSHPYFQNSCLLFREPVQKVRCESCISGASSCFCDLPVACKDTGKNIVNSKFLVSPYDSNYYFGKDTDKPAKDPYNICKESCDLNPACSNFTYFTGDANLCVLYSDCSEIDTTCSGCCSGHTTVDQCSSYIELNSPVRNALSNDSEAKSGKYADYEREKGNLPDWTSDYWVNGMKKNWFQITGEAGTKLAEKFPGFDHCGSEMPMWLKVDEDNQLPSVGTGKQMKVCHSQKFTNEHYPCWATKDTDVMNCGDYFLYQLEPEYGRTYCGF